jgi:hypothetical protein
VQVIAHKGLSFRNDRDLEEFGSEAVSFVSAGQVELSSTDSRGGCRHTISYQVEHFYRVECSVLSAK